MPEKDEFTFDDNDDFPETDLSGAFADAEQEADDPLPEPEESETVEMFEEPVPAEMPESFGGADRFAEEDVSEPPPPEKPTEGSSRTRVLLLILLLVAAVGAGAYYFMGLGELTSESPVKKKASSQVVAVPPPKPAASTVPPPPAEPAKTPAPDVASQTSKVEPKEASVAAEKLPQAKVEVAVPAPAPAKPVETAVSVAKPEVKTVEKTPEAASTKAVKTAASSPVAVGAEGGYTLDAGAFLFAAQRDDLKKKIRELGYEPEISQMKASVRLIRLKVGSYAKGELPAALEKARKITPGAFSMVRDGEHVIYAGSFADQNNVQQLHARFLKEGITLTEEPVKVEKTLSRIRFGRFTDDASAEAAASKAVSAGIPARVVAP